MSESLRFLVSDVPVIATLDGNNLTISCTCSLVCSHIMKLIDNRTMAIHEFNAGDIDKFRLWLDNSDVGDAIKEYRSDPEFNQQKVLKLIQAIKD
jgi:hypothetical protein